MNGQYSLTKAGRFCRQCGAQIPDGARVCVACGVRLDRQVSPYEAPPHETFQELRPGQSRRRQYEAPQPSAQPAERQMQSKRRLGHDEVIAYRHEYDDGSTYHYTRDDLPYQPERDEPQYEPVHDEEPPVRKKKKAAKILLVLLLIVAVAAAALYFYTRSALETPPDMRANPKGPDRMQVTGGGGLFSTGGVLGGGARDTSKYTFLVFGADEGEANTDVIMVVTFDTSDYTFEVVNIPRDTLVNVSWPTKKANSIFANMRHINRGEDDAENKTMAATVEMFGYLLGFEVDYWVRVNMRAFVSLVDAIGGVDFDVPVDMNYTDPYANLTIKFTKGMHHLSGQQALEVVRFRSGYAMGDIGRIGTQQAFLKSAAEQILANRSSISVTTLARVFLNDVKTDMKLSDLIWFGREFMKLSADNVNFHMLPGNTGDSVGRQSYVTVYVDEWLEMVNGIISPFNSEITPNDVSIFTRGADKKFYVTDGNWRADKGWGS